MTVGRVVIKAGRDKPIKQHHPWVFSGAIDRLDEAIENGAIVDVTSRRGEFLARGYLNRRSQIAVRLLTWNEAEAIDAGFWARRLARSIELRDKSQPAQRLVNAESDGLPGLVVDRYNDWLVIQVLTFGLNQVKDIVVDRLNELLKPQGIYERSDVDVREKEGLPQYAGLLCGDEPPELIEIEQDGCRYLVDIRRGHKTGFYLDQRDNRRKARAYCRDAEVLNLFSYTGGFAVPALGAGAPSVVNGDSSADGLALARRNIALNGFAVNDTDFVEADVFSELRRLRALQRTFDVIIADPPKLAQSQSQIERAARAYKDLNLISMQLLRPGGTLITFSCSGLVSPDLFQKILFAAALDAGRDMQIVEKLSQSGDHPILLSFPESAYLKGLVCRAV